VVGEKGRGDGAEERRRRGRLRGRVMGREGRGGGGEEGEGVGQLEKFRTLVRDKPPSRSCRPQGRTGSRAIVVQVKKKRKKRREGKKRERS